MQQYDIIRALGIEVLPSTSLTTDYAMVRGESIALVRPDLDDAGQDRAVGWMLERALSRVARGQR